MRAKLPFYLTIGCMAILIILLLTAGCQAIYKHSQNKARDAKLTLKIAENSIGWAQVKIGFVQGVWYGRMDELPSQIQDMIDEYMKVSVDPNNLTYEQAGYVIGLELRIDEIVFKKFLADNFPELLRFLP